MEPNRPQTPVSSKSPNCSTPSARLATTSESNHLADTGAINLWNHCHIHSKIWEEPSGQSKLFGFITRLGKQSAVLSILISQEYIDFMASCGNSTSNESQFDALAARSELSICFDTTKSRVLFVHTEMILCIPGITRKDLSTSLRLRIPPSTQIFRKAVE